MSLSTILNEMRAVKPVRHASGEVALVPRKDWDRWVAALAVLEAAERTQQAYIKAVAESLTDE